MWAIEKVEDGAFLVAIFGQVRNAGRHRRRGAGEFDGAIVDPDLPGVTAVDPEQDSGHLGASGAHEPGQTQDLPGAHREADVAERPDPGQALDLEDDVAEGSLDLREQRNGTTDHVPDQIGRREISRRLRHDVAPVAKDRRPVAQVKHLVEAMAHEEHRHAAVAELADDRE